MTATHGPVAGRLKRPSWRDPRLLIGLLLIAISVIAVTSLVRSADQTAPYYTANDVLTPGTVLKESDLLIAHVRVAEGVYAKADVEPPWGSVVTRIVGAGELVPADAVSSVADVEVRAVAVVTSTPLARGIETGSIVDVWLTAEALAGPASTQVASGLVVDQVERDEGAFAVGSTETVYVLVPVDAMSQFLGAIATDGDVSIVGQAGAS